MPSNTEKIVIDAGSRHISWEQLQERIAEGIPFVHRIPAPDSHRPAVDIRVSEHGQNLALWIPCFSHGELIASPLAEMDVAFVQTSDKRVIEIKTGSSVLFQEVYNFFVSVSDKVQLDGIDPFIALEETLSNWRELLKVRTILSEEMQLGLRGELFFLRRLFTKLGDDVISAWTGPQRQPHDFRVGETEFEVKTTRGTTHSHIINGLTQLEPSPDHLLYVMSIRFAPAGANAGTTLPQEIEMTRALLHPQARLQFDFILRHHFNYQNEHIDSYRISMQLADLPYLILVDDHCPRLNRQLLSDVPHLGRLGDVTYHANFEGLGVKEGTAEFEEILSKI